MPTGHLNNKRQQNPEIHTPVPKLATVDYPEPL